MTARLLVTLGLFAVALFAGCVGTESANPGSVPGAGAPPDAAAPAEFDETTGAIQGSVTDSELNVLPGVIVGILTGDGAATGNQTVSDVNGVFSFSRLPPGDYQIQGALLGYKSDAGRVTVEAGQVASASLVLEKLRADVAYQFTDIRKAAVTGVMVKLTPQCLYGTQAVPATGNGDVDQFRTMAKTCNGQRRSCDPAPNCEVHYEEPLSTIPNWMTQIAEATWTSQSVGSGRGFMFDITAPNATRGFGGSIDQASSYTFFKMSPHPPLIWRIDNSTTLVERNIAEKDWCCDWFYRVFPGYCDFGAVINNCEATPDYGVAVDNTLTVYYSIFWKDPAPQDFTALPDA